MERSNAHQANDAWESLLTAHAVVLRELAADDMWDELSMREYDVLYTLAKCTRPQRLGELNRHVLLSQPALSRLVERLIDRGLVARTADPSDARCVLLSLTADGRELQRRIGRRHAASVARAVTARLSRAELRRLELLCTALAATPSPSTTSTTSTTSTSQETT